MITFDILIAVIFMTVVILRFKKVVLMTAIIKTCNPLTIQVISRCNVSFGRFASLSKQRGYTVHRYVYQTRFIFIKTHPVVFKSSQPIKNVTL